MTTTSASSASSTEDGAAALNASKKPSDTSKVRRCFGNSCMPPNLLCFKVWFVLIYYFIILRGLLINDVSITVIKSFMNYLLILISERCFLSLKAYPKRTFKIPLRLVGSFQEIRV